MSAMRQVDGIKLIDANALIENFIIVLKRLWWIAIVFALILGTLLPVVSKSNYTPVYRSYCSFSVKVKNNSNTSDLNSLYGIYYDKDLATQLENTFSYILSSDLLTDAIKEDLGPKFAANKITAKCKDLVNSPLLINELKDFDGVVINPPRNGAKAQCEILAKSNIQKIVIDIFNGL